MEGSYPVCQRTSRGFYLSQSLSCCCYWRDNCSCQQESSGVFKLTSDSPLLKLAEVKVRILEAKQTLEDCIAAQEFSRAAGLKDSITELENRRNQIMQEIAESNQPADKEVRTEKVQRKLHCCITRIVRLEY